MSPSRSQPCGAEKEPLPPTSEPSAARQGGEPLRHIAKVTASALHRLLPLLADRGDSIERGGGGQYLWGWRIEPSADGGVLVIATNGAAMGVIHDPKGRTSGPVTILASDGLRAAVTPPPLRPAYYVGDYDEIPLPDQFQPGAVFASGVGAFMSSLADEAAGAEADEDSPMLFHEMAEFGNVWSGGYRLVESYVDWRRALAAWSISDTTPSHQRISPSVFRGFCNISPGTLEVSMPEDLDKPVLVQAQEHPDFVGILMRGRMAVHPPPYPSLPDWLAPAPPAALGAAPASPESGPIQTLDDPIPPSTQPDGDER